MSPFEIFRRNLKPLMVFLTLLALFAFVVLPAMQSYLSKQAGIGTDPGVGIIDGTVVKASRVDYFTQNHQSTLRFLRELATITIDRGGVPRVPGFSYDTESKQVRAVGIASNPTQFATLRTLQFAAEAKKSGFELDDTAIKTWLNRYTDGKLTDGEILRVLMDSSRNRMGQFQLYEQLRNHLMAGVFQSSSVAGVQQGSFPILTPAEQWQNFLRINRKATVQTYGVMVDDYMDQVTIQPSDAEIKAVYDEGINRYSSDQSPLPGFRKRDTATIEYLVADLNKLVDVEKAKFTEEQLRAEYDKRVKAGAYVVEEKDEEPKTDPAAESEKTAPAADAEKTDAVSTAAKPETEPAETKPADAGSEKPEMKEATPGTEKAETAPAIVAPEKKEGESKESFDKRMDEFQNELDAIEKEFKSDSAETAEDAAEKPAPETPAKEATDAPKPEKPAKDAAKDASDAVSEAVEAAKKASEESTESAKEAIEKALEETVEEAVEEAVESADQSNNLTDNGIRLVALLQDEKATAQEAEAAEATTETPEAKTETPATTDSTEETTDDAAEGTDAEGATEEAKPTPKVKPFEEVRDEIAESLAQHPAKKRLEVIVSEANNVMKRYFNEYAIHSGSKTGDPPTRPDLKQLAAELGMDHKEIGPHDMESIAIEPIARSRELGSVQFQRGPPFIAMLYGIENSQTFIPKKTLFSPLQTADDTERKTYVSWKTSEVEDHAPPIDDEGDLKGVRAEVVEAIRRAEARKLAIAAAEKIAEQVNAGKKLADVIPEDKKSNLKTDINPFSWNDAQGFQGVSIGNVPELDSVHDKFMKAVFTTEAGKCSVGVNLPERVVYVVEPISFQPHQDDLKDIFKDQPIQRMMGFALGSQQAGKIISGYYKKVDERTGFSVVQEE